MISVQCCGEWVCIEQTRKVTTEEDGALPIRHYCVGQRHDVDQADLAACRHKQHKITFGIVCGKLPLVSVVAAKFPFNRFDILLSSNAFCAVIEFDHKVEASTVSGHELKATIRIQSEALSLQLEAVLSREVAQLDAMTVGHCDQMNQAVGQTRRVMMVATFHFFEVPSPWNGRVHAIQKPIAFASQLEVLR